MVTEAAIWAALEAVKDPEIPPVSIVDMGMVSQVALEEPIDGQGVAVRVAITPTFVGCPALEIIRQDVVARIGRVDGVGRVEVSFVFDPPWSSDRITPQGRERLRGFGIAPPPAGGAAGHALISLDVVPPCPYCGATNTHMENLFGPTACRSIYYCDACRQPFEGMKPV